MFAPTPTIPLVRLGAQMQTEPHPSIEKAVDEVTVTAYKRGAICEAAKHLQSLLNGV